MRKSNRILPCGVSSAAQRASPGSSVTTLPVTSPCRKARASAPPTRTTPRWDKCAAFLCLLPAFRNIVDPYNVMNATILVYPCKHRSANELKHTWGTPCRGKNFDLIVRGGEVVNHAGAGWRDIGVRAARSPRSATCPRPPPAKWSIARAAHPARRDRQPGPFPRTRPDGRKTSRRARAPRCSAA